MDMQISLRSIMFLHPLNFETTPGLTSQASGRRVAGGRDPTDLY